MKRRIYVLVLGLFIVSLIRAQNADTLTNNSIIKMEKARLSDDLIIEVIQSSPVHFDLGANSLNNMISQNVSTRIIDAMKLAERIQNAPQSELIASSAKPDNEISATVNLPVPVSKGKQTSASHVQKAPDIDNSVRNHVAEAIGYVVPMKDLITFYENEFEKMAETITEWEKSVNDFTDAVQQAKDQVNQAENNLRDEKNADSKIFSAEITGLKKNLFEYRNNYGKAKTNLMECGISITRQMEKISAENIRSAGNIYNEVSQGIKSADSDPSKNQAAVLLTFKDLKVNNNTADLITPALEILVFHRNEIKRIEEDIKNWNLKVKEVILSDVELSKQQEPLKSKMVEYQSDTKKNKTEIAALKKQISAIEKGRKDLADKMEDESKELAGQIKQIRAEVQKTMEQRFADIIENINYSFQEN